MITLYNSLTKQKEKFVPLEAKKVKLYVCGVTVYDRCHIGHARTNVTFDVIVRYFKFKGFDVHYVRNITDIDDKIIKRAQQQQVSTADLVREFTKKMYQDFAALNILLPDEEPTATGNIKAMIAMIETLLEKGLAYVAEDGDVYYDISKFPNYGALSGQDVDALQAGARVEVAGVKHHAGDFVLWKMAKPGEPSWSSPWGAGRPGWHIECSAMAKERLGDQFDIHGGGSDLRFPHHENEIAQSEAANGKKFANYWLHSAMVQVNNEKMSKSLGNFFVIEDVLKSYAPEVVRYFLISGHYRSEIHYSEDNLNSAKAALTRFYLAFENLPAIEAEIDNDNAFVKRFDEAMADDFNTPEALAVLFDLVREINRQKAVANEAAAIKLAQILKGLGGILGILQYSAAAFLHSSVTVHDEATITALVKARDQARQAKDWQKADALRVELDKLGVIVEDTSEGIRWRYR